MTTGGRFDFDDGVTYCGGWEDGKAHGYGVCTGPKGQGEYAGAWHCGYEISGIYTWSSGNNYRGQWTQGKRHGLGVETKGRWVYRGEWTQGFKGRYGVRQSTTTGATYEGTWTTGLQDGYGVETYADGGTYQGQWLRGIRHGYGVRQSVPYGLAAHNRQKSAIRESLTSLRSEQEDDQVVKDRDRKIDEGRGGFVLRGPGMPPMNSTDSLKRHGASSVIEKSSGRSSLRKTIVDGLRLRKQRSTGDIQESTQMRIGSSRPGGGGSVRSTVSSTSRASSVESSQSVMTGVSVHTDSNASFISQDDVADLNMVEIYSGEWKNDKRSGFGVVERSDGLKYEGEWEGNKKHGYGATTFRDGSREEGKYKNNVLTTSGRRSKLFILRANKLKDRVENAVAAANRAAQIAQQKSDIAISRMASARAKAEQAQQSATKAQTDAEKARQKATSYDPNFIQPGVDIMKKQQEQAQIQLQQQQQKSNPAQFGNHTGSSSTSTLDPLSRNAVVENHVPSTFAQHPALAASKTILSRVGINIGGAADAAPPAGSSFVASALRMAAVDSAIAGGGSAAMAVRSAHPQKVDANGSASKASADNGPTSNRNAAAQQHATTTTTTNKKQSSVDEIDHAEVSRFSTLLSPTVIDDHFDQYLTPTTARQPSTAFNRDRRSAGASTTTPASGRPGGEGPPDDGSTMPTFSYDNPRQSGSSASPSDDRPSPAEQQRNRTLLQRRKTLPTSPHPSLVVGGGGVAVGNPGTAAAAAAPTPPKQPTPAVAVPTAASRAVAAPVPASAAAAAPTLRLAPMRQQALPVPSLYRRPAAADGGLLRKAAGSNMGSMPDVSGVAASTSSLMPREEVHVLSQRRREELRRMREEAERRQQQDIVLRLGDVKEWCQERQMLVLLIALNISLATMFFNLLSH